MADFPEASMGKTVLSKIATQLNQWIAVKTGSHANEHD